MGNNSKSRYEDRERYFRELEETSRNYYIDYLKDIKPIGAGTRVMEIGCGEGGNLLPFADGGGCKVEGIDLSPAKIANANAYFSERGVKGNFRCLDFLSAEFPEEGFDIILIHDVIEHIEPQSKNDFFRRLRGFMKDDGIAFFGFPAWQMPFGGHQQTCRGNFLSRLPFIHLLPKSIYEKYLRITGDNEDHVQEMMSIRRSRMTPEKFERLCSEEGFDVVRRTLWLVNPHYKAKFGLKPRVLPSLIAKIPYLRNFFTTSCFYIIRKSPENKNPR